MGGAGHKSGTIKAILPLGSDIEQAFGFNEGAYEITEVEGTDEKGERCKYNGGECGELARHFRIRIEAVIVEGDEIPVYRFKDVYGFLQATDRDVHMCLPHMVKTLKETKPVITPAEKKEIAV